VRRDGAWIAARTVVGATLFLAFITYVAKTVTAAVRAERR
jgi:hypothetical protein